MRRITPLIATLVFAGAVTLSAQWPAYVPPGVPRTAAGAPDLNAPAPRTPEGKPDLSGVWDSRQPLNGRFNPPPVSSTGGPPVATFFDVAANIKEGLPFTPWAAALRRDRMAVNSQDNPDAHCLPIGFMQFHTHSQPRKIVQSRNVIVIIYEANSGLRQIFTDGRPRPGKDADPWWYGYSLGRWEGDTLVVETTNFRPDQTFRGASADMRVTERFTRISDKQILYQFRVEDPKTFTEPVEGEVAWNLTKDTIYEYACHEGNYALPGILAGARAAERQGKEMEGNRGVVREEGGP